MHTKKTKSENVLAEKLLLLGKELKKGGRPIMQLVSKLPQYGYSITLLLLGKLQEQYDILVLSPSLGLIDVKEMMPCAQLV